MKSQVAAVALGVALCASACAAPHDAPEPTRTTANPLENAARGETQREALCARTGSDDLVRDLFCGDAPRSFASLVELQTALGVDASVVGGVSGVSITANSTALAAHSVSAINPRLIIMRFESPPARALTFGYVRGEQSVELAVLDRNDLKLRFYLLAYRQPCNDTLAGCSFGDLLTPDTEAGWTETSLYDEDDLKNSVLDCRSCHQPDGPDTTKFLRMQELEPPWTHWLWSSSRGGMALLGDFHAAHGDEVYAGMPPTRIDVSHPGNISQMIELFSLAPQPNQFNSLQIEDEVVQSTQTKGGAQPEDNRVPGTSPTWRALYDRAKRGEAITAPYHDVKVTDPEKLAKMSEAYAAYRRGELSGSALPDIREAFPDDPRRLAELGFVTEPGLDAPTTLRQACGQCHNARLDQTLSRARFTVELSKLSRDEKDTAIARLRMPESDVHAMPPARIRRLSAQARESLIALLRQ